MRMEPGIHGQGTVGPAPSAKKYPTVKFRTGPGKG